MNEKMKNVTPATLSQTKNGGIKRTHVLKVVSPYFEEVVKGNKTFEVRLFDRDYQRGDFLHLRHYDAETGQFGGEVIRKITYLLTDTPYVKEGYVILGMIDAENE